MGEWAGAIAVVAFAVTIAIGFARQMEITAASTIRPPRRDASSMCSSIPFVWLVLVGLGGVWQGTWRISRVRGQGARARGKAEWGAWLAANALLGFAGYCLLAIVIPYYYG